MIKSHALIHLPLNSLEYSQFSSIYPVFSTPCLYIIIKGIAMDVIIHPFPTTEEEFYQRLSPLLLARTVDSSESSSVPATPSSPVKNSPSETQGSSEQSTDPMQSKRQSKAQPPKSQTTIVTKSDPQVTKKKNDVIEIRDEKDLKKDKKNEEFSQKTLKQRHIRKNQIKIRLPDGTVVFSEFKANETLSSVKNWILKEADVKRVILSTTIPKKTFNESDYLKTLEELNLFGNTLVAEWEEEEAGIVSRIMAWILLLFSKFFPLFNEQKQDKKEEIVRPAVYNGNSTNLE